MLNKKSILWNAAVLAGLTVGAGLTPKTADAQTLPKPDHVVIVMEENHSYGDIIGSSSAPYINGLAKSGASFTQSFAITHPSQPNYLCFLSGSAQGTTNDNCLRKLLTTDNLGAELLEVGDAFVSYSEGLPKAGSTVCTKGEYARKHNPSSDFVNIPKTDNQPYTSFPTNFASLPTVSFIDPNLLDDMHDGTIDQGDVWLQKNIDPYVQWAKTHNSLLIVTWDEDDSSMSNQIPTIFVGPMVKTGQYSETINHYRVLRTIEDMYGLAHAGNAATQTPITDAF